LRQFDSVVLLAGSTGATFTVPLLRDIVQAWNENADPSKHAKSFFLPTSGAVTRHVRFVWVVKSRGQLSWFAEQLSSIHASFQTLQDQLRTIKLELTVYVTCDESFTEEHKSLFSNMTSPNLNAPPEKSTHGPVEFRNQPQSLDEKGKSDGIHDEIREVRPNSASTDKNAKTCGPDGKCLCKSTLDETPSPDTIQVSCCCNPNETQNSSVRTASRPSSAPSSTQPKFLLDPSILVYAGRPNLKEIIRRSLEQALGESAVVVCGPQGLVADVKQHVCSLSDERAVHKGTGAQGIYLHTESFGY
jgi:hypothetical protein